ncbi:MAG: hypothetical protein LUE27_09580 [Clostridia bacterium]|nr:hypothetical protein [Clostridia bacterium]
MDAVAIERDFMEWVAGKLGLSADEGIYRGGVPAGAEGGGVGVLFGAELPSPGFYGFRPRRWNAQILAKFDDRDDALAMQARLAGLFPCAGFTSGETRFLAIEPRGSSEPYLADDCGRERTFLSFNVTLTVLTTGGQESD